MKLSIIVPVYNVEKYLKHCINGLINQNINSSEIILVDDGSTDASGIICDEYSNIYENIIVIHKKNGGLSSARNAGIKKAKGEYLMFIDSDDFIYEKEHINDIFPYLKYDIIQYKMIYYYENKDKYLFLNDLNTYSYLSYEDKIEKKIYDGSLSISACDKIVRRDLLLKNNIFFEEGLLSEDIDWSLKLYLYANSMTILNSNLYVYRQQRSGSISTEVNENNIICLYYIIKKWCNYKYENDRIKENYYNYLAYQYSILISNINKNNCKKELKKEIFNMKFLLQYSKNYKVKKVNKVVKLFGIHIGIFFLKIYIYLKNRGLMKI